LGFQGFYTAGAAWS